MKVQDEFVSNLKFYRKKNISQEQLAELCDCATSTIGCIEIGRQSPSFEMVVSIATAFTNRRLYRDTIVVIYLSQCPHHIL